ncbi:MAG: PD-(D/E)XK nuclease family protein [Spirochaetota bacterium]
MDDDSPFPETVFPLEKRERYAGTDGDERRLFYTAMTRARDMLYSSAFEKKTRKFSPSPYLLELAKGQPLGNSLDLPCPIRDRAASDQAHDPVELSFSDIATWEDCGYRFRLGKAFGFQNMLAEELGYGNAVHHVHRNLAEITIHKGKVPSSDEAATLALREFYAAFANPSSHERMRASAQKLVQRYLEDYGDDLQRIWAVERPFELHTDDGLLSGRADVILDGEGEASGSLAVVDYKVAAWEDLESRSEWQLRVYSHAAGREGWDVRGAYLHALREGERSSVSLGESELAEAVAKARAALAGIRAGAFPLKPGEKKCAACDYREVCGKRATQASDRDV